MLPVAEEIVAAIKAVFEKTSPEMVADTARDGLYLIGGGSLTYGMADFIAQRLKVKVIVPDNPTECVIRGLGKALDDLQMLKDGNYRFRSLEELVIE